ncbi:MAG: flagellar biosynthetic protein FliO [Dehalococcoidia bacterium]
MANRKRLWFIALGCGVLLVALLFVSAFAPDPHPGEQQPSIQTPGQQAAPASGPASSTPAKGSQGFSLGGADMVSLAWRLALAAVVIGGAIVALRWWGRRQSSPRSVTGFLKVVDTLAISNGRSIHLVALGERVIAVGATAQQISLLDELTDEEARQVLDDLARPQHQPIATFAAELFESLRNGRPRAPQQDEVVIGTGGLA